MSVVSFLSRERKREKRMCEFFLLIRGTQHMYLPPLLALVSIFVSLCRKKLKSYTLYS